MLKSGLIVGAISLVLTVVVGFLLPISTPCVAIFAGLAAGYLGGLFGKPADQSGAAKMGASSGAIAAVGALIGGVIGGVISALVIGPEAAAATTAQMGLPTGDPQAYATSYYVSSVALPCCIGLFNVAIMAGLGALGSILWLQTAGKNTTTTPSI